MTPLITAECLALLKPYNWPNGVHCPRCGSRKPYRVGLRNEVQNYRCLTCEKRFNFLHGTFMHGSQIHVRTWFAILAYHAQGRRPVDIHRLLRAELDVKVAYKTVQRLISQARHTELGQQLLAYFSAQHAAHQARASKHHDTTQNMHVQYYASRILWGRESPWPPVGGREQRLFACGRRATFICVQHKKGVPPMFQVIDKFGNVKTSAWLLDQFGPVAVQAPPQAATPYYAVTHLVENADLGPEAEAAGKRLPIGVQACSSVFVKVLDSNGLPTPAIVCFSWPDAPPYPGAGWGDKAVTCYTKANGYADFAMGGGAYYFPPNMGPHQVWVFGPGTSEIVRGLGMLGGTNHRHLDVTFRQSPGIPPPPPPPPPGDPDVAAAIAALQLAVPLLATVAASLILVTDKIQVAQAALRGVKKNARTLKSLMTDE